VRRQEVALVGAGNAAGQATVYLASGSRSWFLVRGSAGGEYVALSDRPHCGRPNVES